MILRNKHYDTLLLALLRADGDAERYKLLDKFKDNPTADATDLAHPAWWRGYEYAFASTCREVNDILDGTKTNVGTATQPWQALRQRLYDIRTLLGLAERVLTQVHFDPTSHFRTTICQWYKVRQDYAKRVAQIQKENAK
jgi:hypothetical protein